MQLTGNLLLTGNGWTIKNHNDINIPTNNWFQMGVYENSVPVSGIIIENGTFDGNVSISTYDPVNQQRHGLYFLSSTSTISNVLVRHCYFVNQGGDGLYIGKNSSKVYVENCRYKDCLRHGFVIGGTGASDLYFQGIKYEPYSKTPSNGNGIHAEISSPSSPVTNILITNCHVERGISLNSSNYSVPLYDVTICNNQVEGRLGIYGVTRGVVSHNIVREPSVWTAGEKLGDFRSLSQVKIANNQFLASTTNAGGVLFSVMSGDSIKSSDQQNSFKGNTVVCKNSHGLWIDQQNGVRVAQNIIATTGTGNALKWGNSFGDIFYNTLDNRSGASRCLLVQNDNTSPSYRGLVKIIGNELYADSGNDCIRLDGVKYVIRENVVNTTFSSSNAQEIPSRHGVLGIGIIIANALPAYGTWRQGDRIYRQNSTAGSYDGWTCVTAGACGGSVSAWSGSTTYYIGDTVTYGGRYYESRTNSNVNKQPDLNPNDWTDLGATAAVWKQLANIQS